MIGSDFDLYPADCSQFRSFSRVKSQASKGKNLRQQRWSDEGSHKHNISFGSFGYQAKRGRAENKVLLFGLIIARRCPLHGDFDFFLECLRQICFHWHSRMSPELVRNTHLQTNGDQRPVWALFYLPVGSTFLRSSPSLYSHGSFIILGPHA